MYYHLFRRTVNQKNGKQVRRWYYWFYDTDGKRKNRVCPNCTNRSDAEAYIKSLAPPLITKGDLIKDITDKMFLPGSDHVLRKQEFGTKFSIDGLKDYRRYILFIQELFGEIPITDLSVKTIISSSDNVQSTLAIGCKAIDTTDYESNYASLVYSWILGNGTSSLLYQSVREENSLCYYISVWKRYLMH